ncbi:MAG: methionyl-tRNA synthetase [Thermoplasmata archaeon]|jgi:methionyl-tRNA synthetase|nr:methionyl-tRNA synthetase [Thermoplasmata archaeon]
MSQERILVCVAWPYANGPLHLGHVAGSLLPPDVFARHQRMRGAKVAMVSGSDMHGTPITVAAEKTGEAPEAFAARFNESHKRSLAALSIQFDLFTSTATANHRETVQDVFTTLLSKGYIVKRSMTAPYDPKARRFLPDRYVEGTCPHCGFEGARGDQCDNCGRTLDPQELKNPRSKLSGAAPEYRETEHFFLRLPAFQQRLEAYARGHADHWRPNTLNFTENWLREGLKDRPITRDMTYGVPIPLEGYDDKRIYVWFEAVIGYLSATKEWAKLSGHADAWKEFWLDARSKSYYFLGKDNIPFHTIIWPAMLMGYSDGKGAAYNLPFDVPANEFMNFQGAKFSKSRGNFITVDEILQDFQADAVRYYLAINMPEKGDANWDWPDFVAKVNDELVGTWGNLAHRVISFTRRHVDHVPAAGPLGERDRAMLARIEATHATVTELLGKVELKKALREVMALAAEGNRWWDEKAPWKQAKEDPAGLQTTLHVGLRLVRSLALMTAPYLPTSAQKLWETLGQEGSVHHARWDAALGDISPHSKVREPEVLFTKLDPKQVESMTTPQPPSASPSLPAAPSTSPVKPQITIDDFVKLDLRVAQVISCEPHPKADKIWVLQVDLGFEKRQILAGLREHVKPEELVGRKIVVIANLAPRTIRGLESNGMVLAAEEDGIVAPLTPAKDVAPGAGIK